MTTVAQRLPLPLRGSRVVLKAGEESDVLQIRRLSDDTIVGHATLAIDRSTLHIAELIVDDPYRGYGAGSEAAHLLIDAASETGFTRVTAWAPPNLGLAVYFWYRMGLRALHGPGPNGGIAFERALASAGSASGG